MSLWLKRAGVATFCGPVSSNLKTASLNDVISSSDPERTASHVEYVDTFTEAGRPIIPQRTHKEYHPEAFSNKVIFFNH